MWPHAKRPCEKRKHQGETEGREYRREVQESATQVVWPRKETRQRLRWKTNSGDGTTWAKRGRPKQRWMDCVNRDMRAIGTTKDEVHDRTGWRRIVSAAATPQPTGFEIVPIRVSETCQNISGHVKCPCMVIRWTCPFLQLATRLTEVTRRHAPSRHTSRRCLSCWCAARCSWSRSVSWMQILQQLK